MTPPPNDADSSAEIVLRAATDALRESRKVTERLSDRHDELSGFITGFRVQVGHLEKTLREVIETLRGGPTGENGLTTRVVILERELKGIPDAVSKVQQALVTLEEALGKLESGQIVKQEDRKGMWALASSAVSAIAAIVAAYFALMK